MSEKELLYIEDALNQLRLIHTKFDNYGHTFQDRELRAFVKELEVRQQALIGLIYKVLQ